MRLIKLLLTLLIYVPATYSQDFRWLKKIDVPTDQTMVGIVADNSGNVYCYGNSVSHTGIPAVPGSFIIKYDSFGNVLFKKVWNTSFYINQLIFVESGQILAASGSFTGQISPDNISLSSNGELDAFVATISTSGTLQWATGFGGATDDEAKAICYNKNESRLFTTGSCKGSIMCNSQSQATCDQSMFIASFELTGNLNSFNTFDFYSPAPNVQGQNCGNYIRSDSDGNMLVLATIEGRHWGDQGNTNPLNGEYVVKISPASTVLWSRYIISSECYYGHSSGNIETDDLGNAYVRKRCDWKYGGEGSIVTLEPTNGNIINEYAVQQSDYTHIHQSENDLFITGTENAYGCPCPSNDFGVEVIKRMSASGNVRYTSTFERGYPKAITPGSSGMVFVYGRYQHDSVRIGSLQLAGAPGTYPYFILAYTEPFITGINPEKNSNTIRIYPNPADVTIEIRTKDPFDKYELSDTEGREVLRSTFEPSFHKTIRTSHLKPGYYTVVLYLSGTIVRREKVMIMH